jgi:hypothetical protein
VQTVPDSPSMQTLPDEQLRLCILSPYAGHHPATGFLVDNVYQSIDSPVNHGCPCAIHGNQSCMNHSPSIQGRFTQPKTAQTASSSA